MTKDEVRVKGLKTEVLEYLLSNDYYQDPAEDPLLSDEVSPKKCSLSELCENIGWGSTNQREIKDAVDELTAKECVIDCEMEEETLVSILDYEDAVGVYELYQEDLY